MDSDQKSIPVVGFLTRNDCDVLRAKTGVYRQVTHRTIILPTPVLHRKPFSSVGRQWTLVPQNAREYSSSRD